MAVLDTEMYWLNKNMPVNRQVELGNTIDLECQCMSLNESTEILELVNPDVNSPSSRLTDLELNEIRVIAPIETSTGVFRVAMPFVPGEVNLNSEYFVEFSWKSGGITKLIRERIKVVADVVM